MATKTSNSNRSGGKTEDGNNVVPVNNVVIVTIVDDYALYDYVPANDPDSKRLKLPSAQGSSSCTNPVPTPESLLYIDPGKVAVTRVPLPPFIMNAALTNMVIAQWSEMRHPLNSIFNIVRNPAKVKAQKRARGQGPRAGQNRVLKQQLPNRMAGRNTRYRERNGLLAVLMNMRLRMKIPDCTMAGMIWFSNAQWFFNVRGVLTRGTFTMTAPIDYYQGLPTDPSRSFNLPCPQDVTLLIRQELAKHGRIRPTFRKFLLRNPAIVLHYNIDMTTCLPFVNGGVVISPVITALAIVPTAAAAVATAPVVIAPITIAPATAPVATAALPMAPLPVAAAPVASVPAAQQSSRNIRQSGFDSHDFSPLPAPLDLDHTQQFAGDAGPQQGAGFIDLDADFAGSQYHDGNDHGSNQTFNAPYFGRHGLPDGQNVMLYPTPNDPLAGGFIDFLDTPNLGPNTVKLGSDGFWAPMFPPADDHNPFGYQGNDVLSGGETFLEEDATAGFTLAGEAEDDERS